jgi:enoyl-CoA hydratase
VQAFAQARTQAQAPGTVRSTADIDRVFALPTVQAIIDTLEADGSEWAQSTAALRKRSP